MIIQLQNYLNSIMLLFSYMIIRQARNAEYNPRRFAAVIMRIREPKTTALIFGSGKVLLISFRKSTPPQNHQLIVFNSHSKQ